MEITYIFPGIDYSVDSILLFQDNKGSWGDSLFYFYPQIDKEKLNALPTMQKKRYLRDVLQELYNKDEVKNEIAEKLLKYRNRWMTHKNQIEDAFSDAFQCDIKIIFNDVAGNITFNPICPRFLKTNTFDIFYQNGERGALGISLHELIHFVWFYIWRKHFNDFAEEYETPHLKWILSEMVVDPIMRKDNRLNEINPFFEEGCAYGFFYSMTINGKPILDTLYEMYKNLNITEFMEQGYEYCKKYEEEIRFQIK